MKFETMRVALVFLSALPLLACAHNNVEPDLSVVRIIVEPKHAKVFVSNGETCMNSPCDIPLFGDETVTVLAKAAGFHDQTVKIGRNLNFGKIGKILVAGVVRKNSSLSRSLTRKAKQEPIFKHAQGKIVNVSLEKMAIPGGFEPPT